MLANPLVLPHADGNVTCIKINGGDAYSGEYLAKRATDEVRVKIRHTKTKSKITTVVGAVPVVYDRHNVEVVQTVYAVGEVAEFTRKVYIVVEQLPSDNDVKLADALADWLIATADANLTSLNNWES